MNKTEDLGDDEITQKMMPPTDETRDNDAEEAGGRPSVKRLHEETETGSQAHSSSTSCCSWLFAVRLLDTVLLLSLCIVQGSLLNYLIIFHRQQTHIVYLWFLADFAVVMGFVGALMTSYQKIARRLRMALKSIVPVGAELPVYGSLPLGYLSWFLYSAVLVAKIVVIFKWEIAQNLGKEGFFTPQLLKIVVGGGASIVFLLLVNSHQPPSNPNDDQRSYVTALCTGTAFEIFDSVAFLELLFVSETRIVLTYPFENTILALASINLILPTVPLLRLSLAQYGHRDRPAILGLLYSTFKLIVIEVGFLSIRAYLWNMYDASTSSVFMLKNILMIFVKLRYIIPEYTNLVVKHCKSKKKSKESISNENASTVEMKMIS